jgi:hypothetical protein
MTHAASVRGPLGGWEQLATRHDELIRVEVSPAEMAVIVDAPNGEMARVAIPYPAAGYGGHELVLSAEERYLALFLYSGQSEVGYELFYFQPLLRHVCSFPYVSGEGFGPAFSPDECRLGLAWATNPMLCLLDEGVEGEHFTTAEWVVDWAKLRIQELPDGPATSCNVRLRLGPGFPFEGNDSFYPERLEVVGGEEARFRTTWGELVRAPLPLPSSLVVAGPRIR